MPGKIESGEPGGVMPYARCTAFSEAREFAPRQARYHDGTAKRSQLAQTPRKTFKLVQRLNATRVVALKRFGIASRAA